MINDSIFCFFFFFALSLTRSSDHTEEAATKSHTCLSPFLAPISKSLDLDDP